MGCAGSTTAIAPDDPVPAAPLRPSLACAGDFHREFILKEKLSQGACGVVYATTHTDGSTEELVVKIVDMRDAQSKHLDFDDKMMRVDRRRQRSIMNEAAMLSAVTGHENVCHMFEYFIQGSLAYIVFELYDRTIPEVLATCATISEEVLRAFFREMLMGIAAVHARRVVHRDVKPDNFMCSGPGNTVKLCDFGLACALGPAGALHNMEGNGVCGTAPYMAPELLAHAECDDKLDVWSFGVVVHVLFCGCFPYLPHGGASSSMKAAILNGVPTSKFLDPSKHHRMPGGMSEVARRFLISVLSRSARKRPTCKEVLRDEFFRSRSLYQVCLRPKFEAAGRCGAFDRTNSRRRDIGKIDLRVQQLQNRLSQFAAAATCSQSSEVSTDIGSRLGASSQSIDSTAPG